MVDDYKSPFADPTNQGGANFLISTSETQIKAQYAPRTKSIARPCTNPHTQAFPQIGRQ
jgi:hypothetical protein